MRSGPARVRNLVASVSALAVVAMTSAGCGMSDITNSSGALERQHIQALRHTGLDQ